jgi:hypothetical protein
MLEILESIVEPNNGYCKKLQHYFESKQVFAEIQNKRVFIPKNEEPTTGNTGINLA